MMEKMLKQGGHALRSAYPWVPRLERILRECATFYGGPSKYILASDYSGQHKTSSHIVYSFALLDLNLGPWVPIRRMVRDTYLGDGRRISFKGMNDRKQRTALIPFLEAAEYLSGCIISIAFDKRLQTLQASPALMQSGLLRGNWKAASAQDMFVKALLAATILARWVPVGADIYWLSDRDSSLANDDLADDLHLVTAKLYGMLTSGNPKPPFTKNSEFFLGTPEAWVDPLVAEDLIALSDLSAGMVTEVVSSISEKHPSKLMSKKGVVLHNKEFKEKVETIKDWYWHQSASMEKTCVVADLHDSTAHMYRLDSWR